MTGTPNGPYGPYGIRGQDGFGYQRMNTPLPDRSKYIDVHEILKAEMKTQGNIVDSVDSGSNQPMNQRINLDNVSSTAGTPIEHMTTGQNSLNALATNG